ncbi:hypothetical protein ACFWBX_27915 [Streptomyces sp. NPDC059991]|uniref:hypothetical protein n=1 Tax=Streptomyces sp. NPDC059991 TaxID=3347028 RepID=UPI00367A4CAD
MCAHCQDLNRKVLMLGDLCLYAEQPDADRDFADVVGGALVTSLPLDDVLPGYGPAFESGPDFPEMRS